MKKKVLLVNGSSHNNGCTFTALSEVAKSLNEEGIETEIFQIGNKPVRGCIACGKCVELGECVFKDDVANSLLHAMQQADGIIIGSPVYYAGPNGALCALLDRVFYSSGSSLMYKPAAAVASARRAGTTATLDRLNKYFSISNMPLVTSQYWNMVHGIKAEDVLKDLEGLQIMRTLGKNMAWMLKNLKEPLPQQEARVRTNFIR